MNSNDNDDELSQSVNNDNLLVAQHINLKLTPTPNSYSALIAIETPVNDDSGISHAIEHLVFRCGGSQPKATSLFELTSLLNLSINATTTDKTTYFHCQSNDPASFLVGLEFLLNSVLCLDISEQDLHEEIYDGNSAGVMYQELLAQQKKINFPNHTFELTQLLASDRSKYRLFQYGGYCQGLSGLMQQQLTKQRITQYHKHHYQLTKLNLLTSLSSNDTWLKNQVDALCKDISQTSLIKSSAMSPQNKINDGLLRATNITSTPAASLTLTEFIWWIPVKCYPLLESHYKSIGLAIEQLEAKHKFEYCILPLLDQENHYGQVCLRLLFESKLYIPLQEEIKNSIALIVTLIIKEAVQKKEQTLAQASTTKFDNDIQALMAYYQKNKDKDTKQLKPHKSVNNKAEEDTWYFQSRGVSCHEIQSIIPKALQKKDINHSPMTSASNLCVNLSPWFESYKHYSNLAYEAKFKIVDQTLNLCDEPAWLSIYFSDEVDLKLMKNSLLRDENITIKDIVIVNNHLWLLHVNNKSDEIKLNYFPWVEAEQSEVIRKVLMLCNKIFGHNSDIPAPLSALYNSMKNQSCDCENGNSWISEKLGNNQIYINLQKCKNCAKKRQRLVADEQHFIIEFDIKPEHHYHAWLLSFVLGSLACFLHPRTRGQCYLIACRFNSYTNKLVIFSAYDNLPSARLQHVIDCLIQLNNEPRQIKEHLLFAKSKLKQLRGDMAKPSTLKYQESQKKIPGQTLAQNLEQINCSDMAEFILHLKNGIAL